MAQDLSMVGKCGVDGIEDTTCRAVGVIVGGTALGGDEQARATLEPNCPLLVLLYIR